MKTILVCNQKGGVGKTLIADELSFAFESDEISCQFIDLDTQGGTLHTSHKVEDAAVCVVDTPGALSDHMREWMDAADYIVIPTRMSVREMEPLERTLEIASEFKDSKRVLVVFNCWKKTNNVRAFMDWFEAKYPELDTVVLPEATAFNDASANGKSIQEYKPNSAAAKRFRDIYSAIKHDLKLKEGWR